MPRAIKAGFETYWTCFGQGPRNALLIHCALASCGAWGAVARQLSGALSMTAFDMPGHGNSADWDNRAEMQGVIADIAAAFLEDGPADVIGHSFGATVALRLAVERPELVRTLTLIEPVFFAVAIADEPTIAEEYMRDAAGFKAAMAAEDFATAARLFTDIWGHGFPIRAVTQAQQDLLAAQMPLIVASEPAIIDDVARLLSPERMARVTMPTLIVEGSASPRIIGAICRGLENRMVDARRAMVRGAGHMVPLTHPDQVSAEILQFLRST